MSCTIQHEIPVAALLPLLKRKVDYHQTNLLFHDYYPEVYERFGIDRSEMMIVMPAVMTTDILVGIEKLKYIGEEESENVSDNSNASTDVKVDTDISTENKD